MACLALLVTNVAADSEGDCGTFKFFLVLTEAGVNITKIVQMVCLTLMVTNVAADLECGYQVLN